MKLPTPLQIYFEADQAGGDAAPLEAFASDAVVTDEGRTHAGHAAIAAWWRAAKEQYRHTAEPCEVREEEGLTLVRARVTGRFPGSPAMLTFAFRLADARIAALRIGA
ncbi:nuclear transport factor 2 family protein [Reyranella sp.]|uniref:nuclear transport factor 2 family protein n=1 Tax=Reyranella sp. TaxID=1929291 RepID=UPI003D146EE0